MTKHTTYEEGGAIPWIPPEVRTLVTQSDYEMLMSEIKEDIASSHTKMMNALKDNVIELYATIIRKVQKYAEPGHAA